MNDLYNPIHNQANMYSILLNFKDGLLTFSTCEGLHLFNTIKNSNFVLKEYKSINSTKLGSFLYNFKRLKIFRLLGFLFMFIMAYVPLIVDFCIKFCAHLSSLQLLVLPKMILFYTILGTIGCFKNACYVLLLILIRL